MLDIEPNSLALRISANRSASRWYAVQTRSRFEKVVDAELAAFGYESFLPSYQELHQWRDRNKLVELPLFSGYVFIRMEDAAAVRLQVLRSSGVVRILGTGGTIEPIPDWEIESIRRLLQSGERCFPHPSVREGSWVRVWRGALAGVEGRLIRVKSQARLVLSIDLLSRSVATEVDARDIEPAAQRQPWKC